MTGATKFVELDRDHLELMNIVSFNRKDPRARPFNLLRSQVLKRLGGKGARLAGVTSTAPGAGKSFTSVNLAISLARFSDLPVILVDLDFRRGAVAEYLGLQIKAGVADVLDGKASIDEIEICAGMPNLRVLPAVVGEDSGSELLASSAFARLVSDVRARLGGGGIALFDLPPVYADDDVLIATQHLDGYLIVADAGVTMTGQLADCIERLSPSVCLGTILNRYQGGLIDSYDYGYGYKYGGSRY